MTLKEYQNLTCDQPDCQRHSPPFGASAEGVKIRTTRVATRSVDTEDGAIDVVLYPFACFASSADGRLVAEYNVMSINEAHALRQISAVRPVGLEIPGQGTPVTPWTAMVQDYRGATIDTGACTQYP
jgi:hypothetical protein